MDLESTHTNTQKTHTNRITREDQEQRYAKVLDGNASNYEGERRGRRRKA